MPRIWNLWQCEDNTAIVVKSLDRKLIALYLVVQGAKR